MRSATTAAILLVTTILLVAAAPPFVGAVVALGEDRDARSSIDGDALWRTLGWTGGVALAAAVVGWAPGRVLARRRGIWAFLSILPLTVPHWLLVYGLWQSTGPGTLLGDLAGRADATSLLRQGVLAAGLLAASWPIVAWSVAAEGPPRGATAALASLDGWSLGERWRGALREDASALLRGAIAAMMLLAGTTVAFDLAGVRTFGFELRTLDAEGAPLGAIVRLGAIGVLPGIVLLVLAATLPRPETSPEEVAPRPSRGLRVVAAAVVGLLGAAPVALLVGGLLREPGISRESLESFGSLHADAVPTTLGTALASGTVLALLAAGLLLLWRDGSRIARTVAIVQSVVWAVLAGLPAAAVAAATITAWNRSWLDSVYESAAIVVVGHVGRFGVLAAAAAWWLARRRDAALDLRSIDGPRRLGEVLRAERPRLVAAMTAAGAVGASLALGEIDLTARLQPPGDGWIAVAVLNAIHYQRGESVLLAALAMTAMGAIAAGATMLAWRPLRSARRAAARAVVLAMAVWTLDAAARHDQTCFDQAWLDRAGLDRGGLDRGREDRWAWAIPEEPHTVDRGTRSGRA